MLKELHNCGSIPASFAPELTSRLDVVRIKDVGFTSSGRNACGSVPGSWKSSVPHRKTNEVCGVPEQDIYHASPYAVDCASVIGVQTVPCSYHIIVADLVRLGLRPWRQAMAELTVGIVGASGETGRSIMNGLLEAGGFVSLVAYTPVAMTS